MTVLFQQKQDVDKFKANIPWQLLFTSEVSRNGSTVYPATFIAKKEPDFADDFAKKQVRAFGKKMLNEMGTTAVVGCKRPGCIFLHPDMQVYCSPFCGKFKITNAPRPRVSVEKP